MTRQVDLAALFMMRDPRWIEPIRTLGWWILLCPPLGWLMALGYRKEVVLHMTRAGVGPLPEWPGLAHLSREGFKALGVISVYLAPTLILGWHLGAQDGWSDVTGGIMYCLCSLFLVPLTLPATPLAYMLWSDVFTLSTSSGLIIFGLSACTTFIIPAGFKKNRGARWEGMLH